MKAKSLTQKRLNKTLIAGLTLMLGAIGMLLWSPGSQAQQEPNRQLVQTNAQRAGNARRIALVIGNGAYKNAAPLKNPPNDARDMAATLKQLGFTVASAINADQPTMKRLIREFGQQLKSGGQGLFYYAGHGVQLRGRNYLIPANAEIMSETDVEDQGVDLSLVLGLMDEAENGLNIVILDACRNNPFARSFRSAGSGLAQVDAPTGTLIAYATSPGRVASDGQGRNGLYTSELLSQMRVTGIGVEEMFKRVRAGVQRQTSGQQVPWESSSLVGDFYFAAPTFSASTKNANNNGTGEETVNRMALDPAAFELSYWDSIKSSANPDDFKAYLEKYPGGQFATLAKNRIKNLEVATKPAEPEPTSRNSGGAEITFWDFVKNSSNPEDFRAYLKKYPNGEFSDLAKNRINSLEANARGSGSADSPVEISGEPRHHPKFENEFVRVWDVTVPPGDVTLWHIHRNDNVIITFGDASLRIDTVGAAPTESQLKFGDVGFRKATYVHRAINVGTTPFHNFTIEILKSPLGSQELSRLKEAITRTAVLENDRVRVYKVSLAPGESTGMHTHLLSGLAIAITAGEVLIEVEGNKEPQRVKFAAGDVRWGTGSVTHSIKNVGKTRFEAVDIELK
ncbi:MAG TPA: caspase family protein [Pyrinomonadaceae bacterium]